MSLGSLSSILFASLIAFVSCNGNPAITPTEAVDGDQDEAAKLEPGQRFPSIYLPYLEGDKAGSIADFRGKKVVLHVFASW